MKRELLLAALLFSGCGVDPAADAVQAFAEHLRQGSAGEAWNLLTPETHGVYDSTAAVLHRFGYEESLDALEAMVGEITLEEFEEMDGYDLFLRMAAENPETGNLSGSVRSVRHVSDSLAVVTLATSLGVQEVGVEMRGGRWLVDLTTLTPPAETGR